MQVTRSIILESAKPVCASRLEPTDRLWERVSLLQKDDRILLELFLRAGASHRQIGRILHRPPGSVTRAIRRLGKRLHDPLVLTLLHPDCPLDPEVRQIGVEHFLTGRTVPQLARQHEMPAARVRRIVQSVRSWHRGVEARRVGNGQFSSGG